MPKPPIFLETWLRRLLPERDRESLPGDFAERFHQIAITGHYLKALFWYLLHIVKLIPNHVRIQARGQWALLKHVAMASFRLINRQRFYMVITIVGMVIGLTIALAVIGHISYEMSFEDSHRDHDRIYRLNARHTSPDGEEYSAQTLAPLGEELQDSHSGIEAAAIFRVLGNVNLKLGEKGFMPDDQRPGSGYIHNSNCFCANTDFLNVFTLPLLTGDKETVLNEPFSVLITESAARTHFGQQDPMGQTVMLGPDLPCKITGILKDIPYNTQVHCDFIVSWPTLSRLAPSAPVWDRLGQDYIYVKLRKQAKPVSILESIPAILKNHLSPRKVAQFGFELQPLKSIYFSTYSSGRRGDLRPHGETSMLWTVMIIGAAILLLAIFNFINLSTARSADRLKEVGLRKVIGATKGQLLKQFLGETLFIMLLALVLSTLIYEGFKLWVTPLLPRPMFASFYNNPRFIISTAALILSVSVAAGFYPAWVMMHWQPAVILQKRQAARSNKSLLRKTLVIFQFSIAIAFVGTTVLNYNQIRYLTSMPLGFRTDNMLVLTLNDNHSTDEVKRLKAALQSGDQALSVTQVNAPPGRDEGRWLLFKDALCSDEERVVGRIYNTDSDFVSTFGIELIQGRLPSEQRSTDYNKAILINESGAQYLGMTNPIGQQLYRQSGKFYEIVGIVKDFTGSKQTAWGSPLSIIKLSDTEAQTLVAQLPSGNRQQAIQAIQKTWTAQVPDQVFSYSFLDDDIKAMYADVQAPMRLMAFLALLTLFMAGSGIMGLVAYSARQKTKEIGIRKVMGASVKGIVYMLAKEFIPLIVIALCLAAPLSYMAAVDMLNDYAVRAPISPLLFFVIGLVSLGVALSSAALQGVKAARANPIKAIQHD